MEEKNIKKNDCCQRDNDRSDKKNESLFSGILYGIIPHSFCILFVVLSVIGATTASQFMRQFMLLPYFLPLLIGVSFVFALISAMIYLRKTDNLSYEGIVRKRNYLLILFSTVIVVNLLFFEYVMPMMGNIKVEKVSDNNTIQTNPYTTNSLDIAVALPCEGHAFLVTDDLQKLDGVKDVRFTSPNKFNIDYDPTIVSKETILAQEVFKTYKATIMN
ncbi:MAG: hypothetical protein PHW52_04280 [Candidatus Pacebacteria bacterium]|nr:hypothetical protein [Candidatus Paceibacterota bacterium]